MTDPLVVREIIVVEGIHDKHAVDRAVQAEVWVIGGDRIAASFLRSLARVSRSRGVIVLTDPDGPGERIRARIARAVPDCRHAFLPRQAARGDGRIGVEYASPEAIRAAIAAVRTAVEPAATAPLFTLQDLMDAGLAGAPGSAQLRARVGDCLGIGSGNAKAFLRKLNTLQVTREEWRAAVDSIIAKGTLS